jgi:cysteine desulfurase/selenocysteine lyase
MDEITPDIVARIASKLYNEGPCNGPTSSEGLPHGAPQLPSSGYSMAPSSGHAQVPSFDHATQNPSTAPVIGSFANRSAAPAGYSDPRHATPRETSFGHPSPVGTSEFNRRSFISPGVHSVGPHHPQEAPTPVMGVPAAASTQAGYLPNQNGSFPTVPQSPLGSSFPSLPSSFSAPGFPTNTPSFSQFSSPSTPTFAGAPQSPTNSPDGLSSFVRKIRESHFGDRQQRVDSHGGPVRVGRNPEPMRGDTMAHSRPFDVNQIRKDFPILHQGVHGKPLVWFDNAATTQKPQSVIDAISEFYENDNSNIHRAAHSLAARATDAYEKARQKVQTFIGASSIKEIVFVRGTTEGINFITQTYGRKFLQPGDEIVMSTLEHHANIVPWQMIAKEKGAVIRVIPVNDRGEILLEEYQRLLGPRTKVVALTHASNSLGTILPIHDMTQMAKRYNARVIIDGAQSVAHIPVNMQELGADFFVFSGHKIFGPTGIGVVYVNEELHDIMPPWQGGGNMIRNVTFEDTSFAEAPAKFEAGTPNIADAVGLGAALDYVQRLGLQNIAAHEHDLLHCGTELLSRINGVRIVGTARDKVSVLSFVLPNKKTEEVGRLLDMEGIAVRSGHHCSQPSLRRFGLETTVRPSFSLYNTREEVERLAAAVRRIRLLP